MDRAHGPVGRLLGGGLWSMVDHGQGWRSRLAGKLTAWLYVARNLIAVV
jgi:hypothetical protein